MFILCVNPKNQRGQDRAEWGRTGQSRAGQAYLPHPPRLYCRLRAALDALKILLICTINIVIVVIVLS